MKRAKKDRSQEVWILIAALIVAISVAMYSITYLNYSVFAGIVFGFLASLPFGVSSRLVHIYGETVTARFKDWRSRTSESLKT